METIGRVLQPPTPKPGTRALLGGPFDLVSKVSKVGYGGL